ncbi:MAG: hypothetical protein RBT19_14560, partial [Tenuifilaceae bacterium]|nr:hypothetical protein [Tenuifilaceae bacterium]
PQAREREKHLKTGWGRLALKKKIEQYRAGLSASPNGVGDRKTCQHRLTCSKTKSKALRFIGVYWVGDR